MGIDAKKYPIEINDSTVELDKKKKNVDNDLDDVAIAKKLQADEERILLETSDDVSISTEHSQDVSPPPRSEDAEFNTLKDLQDNVMSLFLDEKLISAKSDEEFWDNISELRNKVIKKLDENAHLENEKAVKGFQVFNFYKRYKRDKRKYEWQHNRDTKRSDVDKERRRLESKSRPGKRERMKMRERRSEEEPSSQAAQEN